MKKKYNLFVNLWVALCLRRTKEIQSNSEPYWIQSNCVKSQCSAIGVNHSVLHCSCFTCVFNVSLKIVGNASRRMLHRPQWWICTSPVSMYLHTVSCVPCAVYLWHNTGFTPYYNFFQCEINNFMAYFHQVKGWQISWWAGSYKQVNVQHLLQLFPNMHQGNYVYLF